MIMEPTAAAETLGAAAAATAAAAAANPSAQVGDNNIMVSKSTLDNIVGNLWQARQESSGSSQGNQSPRNGDELSDGENGSVEDEADSGSTEGGLIMNNVDPSAASAGGGINKGVRLKDTRDLIIKGGEHEDENNDANNSNNNIRHSLAAAAANFPHHPLLGSLAGLTSSPTAASTNNSGENNHMDKDAARALLAGLPPMPTAALEAFTRHRDSILANTPQSLLAGLRTPPSSLLPPPPPMPGNTPGSFPSQSPRPPSQPPTPSSQQSNSPIGSNGSGNNGGGSHQNWSFEEQFKQLYEIDDNPKRKEFLDDLFTYMQKKGTPINRLPIMAKQVLDLFELYNLVVARGGLVEVINKKLWQEVIKGLGLPSSITSAAFTLRTQYTKYLYPLECRSNNLSSPHELQAAIEGNKREGRRTSYGSYPSDLFPGAAHLPPSILGGPAPNSPFQLPPRSLAQMNGSPGHLPIHPPNSRSPPMSGLPNNAGNGNDPLSALEMTRMAALWKMYNANPAMLAAAAGVSTSSPTPPTSSTTSSSSSSDLRLPQLPPLPPSAAGGLSLPNLPNLPADLLPEKFQFSSPKDHQKRRGSSEVGDEEENKENNHNEDDDHNIEVTSLKEDDSSIRSLKRNGSAATANAASPPAKRALLKNNGHFGEENEDNENDDDEEMENNQVEESEIDAENVTTSSSPRKKSPTDISGLLPGANIKITSRGDAQNGDGSLVVSMEINGISYQGVLFAQQLNKSRTS